MRDEMSVRRWVGRSQVTAEQMREVRTGAYLGRAAG